MGLTVLTRAKTAAVVNHRLLPQRSHCLIAAALALWIRPLSSFRKRRLI